MATKAVMVTTTLLAGVKVTIVTMVMAEVAAMV